MRLSNFFLFTFFSIFPTYYTFDICQQHLSSTSSAPFTFSSLEISPNFPTTEEYFELSFSATANKNLNQPTATFSLYVLGVLVERKQASLCEQLGNCPVKAGDVIEAVFRHDLAKEIPEDVELTVKVELSDGENNDVSTSCVQEHLVVRDRPSNLLKGSQRFGFDTEEIDFLFQKWFEQHEDNIYLPQTYPTKEDERTANNDLYIQFVGKNKLAALEARKNIFENNLIEIAKHNADSRNSWKKAMNQFGHLTPEEFKTIYASGIRSELSPRYHNKVFNQQYRTDRKLSTSFRLGGKTLKEDLPEEINWVQKGAVTPVKNQGACGSCWSFATTGAMEGAYFIKYNKLVSFSEQELVSCDHVDMGCNGGAMDNAFNFAAQHQGLCTEEDYPYSAGQGIRGFCNVTCSVVPNSAPKGFVDVEHEEDSLMAAVAKQPVAVAIEADEQAFQFYSSGVLTAPCSQKLDHGVLVVGYGTEEGVEYWLVKNSWGPMWGLQGYIKIERGVEQEEGGECGILLGPSYPTL